MSNELVDYSEEARFFLFPDWDEHEYCPDGEGYHTWIPGYSPDIELVDVSGHVGLAGPIRGHLAAEYFKRKLVGKAKYHPCDTRTMTEEDELKVGKAVHEVLKKERYRLGSVTHTKIAKAVLPIIRGLYIDGYATEVREKNEELRKEINARFLFAVQEVNEVLDAIACGTEANPVKAVRNLKEKVSTW